MASTARDTPTSAAIDIRDRANVRSPIGVARAARHLTLTMCVGLGSMAPSLSAQSVVERSPNISGDWPGTAGVLYFNFLHRFRSGPAPERKVASAPTFLVAGGLPRRTMLGLNYATNSDLAPRYPNEWEFFGRWRPVAAGRAWPFDVAMQLGYNLAAESADGELTLGRQLGPVRVRVAGRIFSHAFGVAETRTAIAGGGVLRLGRYVAVAADMASVSHRPVGYDVAWSGALQIAIPYTPHTLSLQATNTNTATLEGSSASRGGFRRYGFEFTIPITVRRFLPSRRPPSRERTTVAATDVRVVIRDDTFAPARIDIASGTAVVWTNDDTRDHTVTDEVDGLDSGIIAPGGTWRYVFARAGTYAIRCTPHPFMTALVVVH